MESMSFFESFQKLISSEYFSSYKEIQKSRHGELFHPSAFYDFLKRYTSLPMRPIKRKNHPLRCYYIEKTKLLTLVFLAETDNKKKTIKKALKRKKLKILAAKNILLDNGETLEING